MLNRFKKAIYYCRRLPYSDDEIERFAPPERRYLNITSISDKLTLMSAGELSERTLTARIPMSHKDEYFEGDRLFVYTTPSEEFDETDPKCDFIVKSVLPMHMYKTISAERIV